MRVGHLYTTFGDKLRTCPRQHSPCAVIGCQGVFAIALETLNKRPPPGMCCAAEMSLYNRSILVHSLISVQESNKWKPCPKVKLHLGVPFFFQFCLCLLLKNIYSQCSQCFNLLCSHLPASRVVSILNNAYNLFHS